ncbi:hypothetical protein [Methylobacterium sp. A54F]
MSDAPSPDNNLILRSMQGMRRDMIELADRETRVIDLLNRVNMRLDEASARVDQHFARVERQLSDLRSDVLLLENKTLSAITEVRNLVAQLDEGAS